MNETRAWSMETRHEPRLEINLTVTVTTLGPESVQLPGEIVNLSGRGACVLVGQPFPLDSAVQVEVDDALLLGEVQYCRPEGARFAIGLSVEHWLPSLKELAHMRQAVIGEPGSVDDHPSTTPDKGQRLKQNHDT